VRVVVVRGVLHMELAIRKGAALRRQK
jgi:hypothetical protein